MSSLSRKLRRNKAKKDFKKNGNGLTFNDYWNLQEGKPLKGQYKEVMVEQKSIEPEPSPEELEQEKKRKESIETGKSFLKGLDIFNKKVEDLKANDEHGEHN